MRSIERVGKKREKKRIWGEERRSNENTKSKETMDERDLEEYFTVQKEVKGNLSEPMERVIKLFEKQVTGY